MLYIKIAKMSYCIQDVSELKTLYKENLPIIKSFYEKNEYLDCFSLRKVAVTGSTFRAFHRKDKWNSYGMSYYFEKAIEGIFEEDPTREEVRNKFIKLIFKSAADKFINWTDDNAGRVKILKLYNLYSNYRIAYNFNAPLPAKIPTIKKLKVPLDKYSLTFIRDDYNKQLTNGYFKIPANPSMGSIKSLEHYKDINNYIENISKNIAAINKVEFCPVFIDIIQASKNNLKWYTN